MIQGEFATVVDSTTYKANGFCVSRIAGEESQWCFGHASEIWGIL